MEKKYKGFTLAELLIVVAIIAVLVAISIPIFTSQIHKSEVSTDWANVRAYYAELQYDYIANERICDECLITNATGSDTYTLLNGEKQTLKTGRLTVYNASEMFENMIGYIVIYTCNKSLAIALKLAFRVVLGLDLLFCFTTFVVDSSFLTISSSISLS